MLPKLIGIVKRKSFPERSEGRTVDARMGVRGKGQQSLAPLSTGATFGVREHNGTVPDQSPPKGHPLAVDYTAESTSTDVPGFLARPSGAPVYHGFPLLNDVLVDGFTLGMITDFETVESREGDAFVVAPDNSRGGLVWEVSDEEQIAEICPPTKDRWGVWAVSFPFEMTSRENAKLNLQALLPQLKPKWEQWRREYGQAGQ